MFYINKPTPRIGSRKAKTEQVEKRPKARLRKYLSRRVARRNKYHKSIWFTCLCLGFKPIGFLCLFRTLPLQWKGKTTTIENEVLELKVSNKGGYIVEAKLKEQTQFRGATRLFDQGWNNDLTLQFSFRKSTIEYAWSVFEPSFTKTEITRYCPWS